MDKFVIPYSADEWSESAGKCQFRRWPHNGIDSLWKKHHHPGFRGGFRITLVPMVMTRAQDWIAEAVRLSGKPVDLQGPPISHP